MTTGQKIAIGGASILLLGALYYVLNEDDRPPIVVEDGSVTVTAEKGRSHWRQHGSDRRYEQHHPSGRDVDGLSANSNGCVVSGDSIVVTLSDGGTVTVSMHRTFPYVKDHADVTIVAAGNITLPEAYRLSLDTTARASSFAAPDGSSCTVTNGRIEIEQVH